MTVRNLESLFHPASVAVIGASDRAQTAGATVFQNLIAAGYAGPLWPVSLRHRSVAGRRAYKRVSDLPAVPALAVVCTPPHTVPGIIDELGRAGTRAAVVMTGGLDRATAADGRSCTAAMLEAARPWMLRVLGPNCVSLLVPGIKLNASLCHAQPLAGSLAFVSQSGALTTGMLDWAALRGIGFSHFISLGEGADVDFGDMLDWLASESSTRAILLYIQSIRHARKFMSAARAAARNKPVIAVKAGRVPEGTRAARLHTGAVVESDDVYDAALARAGILRVATTIELFGAAETLGRARPLTGNRLAILTNGGGPGLLAADALVAGGGRLAALGERTMQGLEAALSSAWSHANPVDIVGHAPAGRYVAALDALLADPEADAVVFIHAPTAMVPSTEIAQACAPLVRKTRRNVFACWLGGASVKEADALFSEAGAPTYVTPEGAVHGFLQLADYRRRQELLMQTPPALAEEFVPDAEVARAVIRAAIAEGRDVLDGHEAKRVLSAYGIPVAEARHPRDPADTGRLGQELAIGAATDPVFGPVILFGEGGATAEAMEDRAVALPPLNLALARDLVARTRVSRLLEGHRGRQPANRGAIDLALVKISQLIADLPWVAELDVNPLLADSSGVTALHARIRVVPTAAEGTERFAIRPYPVQLEERVEVKGEPVVLRPIRPEDEPQHRELLANTDPDDLQLRFFHARRDFAHSELARFTQIDYDREMAFIASTVNGAGAPRTLAVARAIADPDNVEAEFALLVRSDQKRRGLGRLLLAKLVRYCRERGTQRIAGEILARNAGMLALCRALGFTAAPQYAEPGVIRMVLPLVPRAEG